MGRVQFNETVTVPGGVAGALIPVAGIACIPFMVNPDGTEGPQANAYESRNGNVAAPTLVTDASGSVSYWLDAGDYDIQVEDQQSPPRIQPYTRGFTAPIIDTTAVVQEAQNSIQFSGDTKFSMQTVDHGLKIDGTYEWLIAHSDPDGGGRKLLQQDYQGLWNSAGQPPIDSLGYFRLPNVSGRALIAAGHASGLTARQLFDMLGEESHQMSVAEMASHAHSLGAASTGTYLSPAFTGIGIFGATTGVGVASANAIGGGSQVANTDDWPIISAGVAGGSADTVPRETTQGLNRWGGTSLGHAHGINDPGHAHAVADPEHLHFLNDPTHAHSLGSTGSNVAHNNMQPSTGMNLFVKS